MLSVQHDEMRRGDTALLSEAKMAWQDAERNAGMLVSDMAVCLEDVLACNKFTRRRAALKGSALHLPGLIKAVSTDSDPEFVKNT